MAKALGHKNYNHRLIGHYLPEPLLNFFQERWIRIFQTGMIVEALKDSEYLLQATEFKNIDELDSFLRIHALKSIPDHTITSIPSESTNLDGSINEVVFGVNTSILAILLSLHMAVEDATARVCGKAIYWAGIGSHLIAYLESDQHGRQDLRDCLAAAKSRANPARMREIIYAQ